MEDYGDRKMRLFPLSNLKYVVPVLIAFSLTVGSVRYVHASSSYAKLYVDPPSVIDISLVPPKNFSVSATIANVTMLYGVEFKFYWNTTLLDLTHVSFSLPWGSFLLAKNETNESLGRYWLSVNAMSPSTPFNGSRTVVTFTFKVANMGSTVFHFADTILGDKQANNIFHQIVDGFFANGLHDVAVTSFKVWPTAVYQGDPVNVEVTVENQGTFQETFSLLIYADGADGATHLGIANQTILLGVGEFRVLGFVWNTTGVPYGSYLVTAEVMLPGDHNPENGVAHAIVGGICVRHAPPPSPIWGLIAAVVYGVAPLVLLVAGVFGIFKLLATIRFARFDYS